MPHRISEQGSATADRAGDGPAGSDTASSEDADGGFKARKAELRIPGMHDSEEAEYPAEPPEALCAAVAKSEGDEEDARSCQRIDQ